MSRRSLAIGAASALALAFTALIPTAANAAPGDCAVDLKLPAKVVLDSPRKTVAVKVNSSPQGCMKAASYEILFEGSTSIGVVNFNGSGSYLDIPASNGAGDYTAVFQGGVDKAGDAIAGKDTRTPLVAKLAARTAITSSSRAGKKVTMSVHVGQYNPGFGDWDDAKGTRVALQASTPFGWKTLKTVTTDRLGDVTATVNAKTAAVLRFRAVAAENSEHWSRTSATVKR